MTPFYKRGFPALWFGMLALVLVIPLGTGAFEDEPARVVIPYFAVPIFMAIVGVLLMRILIWDLVDEVLDGGEYLVVRNRGEEDRVPLTNIMNVSAQTIWNPRRISLRLDVANRFGKDIVFSPISPITLNPFAPNAVAEDLIERVDRARAQRSAR